MASTIDALRLRKTLGARDWFPPEPWGPDGWCFGSHDYKRSIIASCAWMDGVEWIHASIAYNDGTIPTNDDMQMLHAAVFGSGFAYQVFPAVEEGALHLFGRSDGRPVLPEFGGQGAL